MLSNDIIEIICGIAPESLADSWDNSGLQMGSRRREVEKILVVLDLERNAVKKAVEEGFDMIVTHHPFFFKDIKNISTDGTRGEIIKEIIKHDIVVYSAHTSIDVSKDGMNRVISEKLGLKEISPIVTTARDSLYKVAVYAPKEDGEKIRSAAGVAGAGNIGNYDNCSFTISGEGRFRPLEGSEPHVGSKDKLELVEEEKLEFVVEKSKLQEVVEAVLQAHPYEEVAYDVYRLENEGKPYGYGGIGELDVEQSLIEFAKCLKEQLGCGELRVYGDLDTSVKRVAFCGGSGASFIGSVAGKADVYVTGDIKYHDTQKASEEGLALIDAGHFGTEQHIVDHLAEFLSQETGLEVERFKHDFSDHITL